MDFFFDTNFQAQIIWFVWAFYRDQESLWKLLVLFHFQPIFRGFRCIWGIFGWLNSDFVWWTLIHFILRDRMSRILSLRVNKWKGSHWIDIKTLESIIGWVQGKFNCFVSHFHLNTDQTTQFSTTPIHLSAPPTHHHNWIHKKSNKNLIEGGQLYKTNKIQGNIMCKAVTNLLFFARKKKKTQVNTIFWLIFPENITMEISHWIVYSSPRQQVEQYDPFSSFQTQYNGIRLYFFR